MKIHFTKKEYRLLLDLLTIADWVLHAHEYGESDKSPEHDALMNKIMSLAKEFKCEDIVEHDPDSGKYYSTIIDQADSTIYEFLRQHDEEVFWEELAERLGERDLRKKLGPTVLAEMDRIKRMEELSAMMEKYADEFEEYGITRLQIKNKE